MEKAEATQVRAKIVLLPGDGIGPEVVGEGKRVLEAVAKTHGHTFEFDTQSIGGKSIDDHGSALTEGALAACQSKFPLGGGGRIFEIRS